MSVFDYQTVFYIRVNFSGEKLMLCRKMKGLLAGASIALGALFAASAQASHVTQSLEQVSPVPEVFIQGVGGDPVAGTPGIDFNICGIGTGDVTANIQFAGLGQDADFAAVPGGFIPGNIALIDRGSFSFVSKILGAETAGASGVLLANSANSANGQGILGCGGDFTGLTIPGFMIRRQMGDDFLAQLANDPVVMHMAIVPGPSPPSGIWNARIIAIDDQNGATDHDINNTVEALGILAFADGGANTGGWNIRYDVSDNRNVIDMAGGGGTFPVNHHYPNDESTPNGSPGQGEDFLVSAITSTAINIPEGDWTIAFGRDDGGLLRIAGVTFLNEVNTNGDPGLDDTIFFNGTGGHAWTAGEFTVGAGGLSAVIEAGMFERGGGDSFEIAIAPGHLGNAVANDGTWLLLEEGAHGWSAIPEPSTLILSVFALVGLLSVRRRRR
jgi:hypothetical protein